MLRLNHRRLLIESPRTLLTLSRRLFSYNHKKGICKKQWPEFNLHYRHPYKMHIRRSHNDNLPDWEATSHCSHEMIWKIATNRNNFGAGKSMVVEASVLVSNMMRNFLPSFISHKNTETQKTQPFSSRGCRTKPRDRPRFEFLKTIEFLVNSENSK